MRAWTGGVLCALLSLPTTVQAQEAEETEESATEAENDGTRGIAIGVGTGPQPIQTLTLGLTGLAGRILVPAGSGSFVVSGGHTSLRTADFQPDGFADRSFTRIGGTNVALGYRGGSPPAKPKVVPYGVGLAMVTRANTNNGDAGRPERNWGTGLWALGAMAGVGADAFVNPSVSAGVEVGGLGTYALGGERWRGEVDDKFSAFGLSTYASAQLTVWK